jgi:hypothetical protein
MAKDRFIAVLRHPAFALAGAILFAAAAFALFGFASSCKAATERATLRYVRWRKAWRAYAVPALAMRTG